MPIIFLHGVNVRQDNSYDQDVMNRDLRFRQLTLQGLVDDPDSISIYNPYWGDLGAHFPWNHGSLPDGSYESFGNNRIIDELLQLTNRDPEVQNVFLVVARNSLVEAIDLIGKVSEELPFYHSPEWISWLHNAAEFALTSPNLSWFDAVENDYEFLDALNDAIGVWLQAKTVTEERTSPPSDWESFGAWTNVNHWLGQITGSLQTQFTEIKNRAFRRVRPSLHRGVATFLGDVLVYTHARGTRENPGPIVQLVIDFLEKAVVKRKAKTDPLIVIAHSMGGNIAYDILSHYRPDIIVDVLITVGSQVALMEELKLFCASNPGIPSEQIPKQPKPTNILKWINLFDETDILGFAAGYVFTEVKDYSINVGPIPLLTHMQYFDKASFFIRLHERIKESYS